MKPILEFKVMRRKYLVYAIKCNSTTVRWAPLCKNNSCTYIHSSRSNITTNGEPKGSHIITRSFNRCDFRTIYNVSRADPSVQKSVRFKGRFGQFGSTSANKILKLI